MYLLFYAICALFGFAAGFLLKGVFVIALSIFWLVLLFTFAYPDPDSSRRGYEKVFVGLASATSFVGAMWLAYGIRWVGDFSFAEISSFFLR